MIELRNLTKYFDKKVAVQNLNLKMEAGKITMLIGPSGCGKTTTLKMINRLIDSTEGDILIDDKSIYELDAVSLRRSIGYVIQETGLFPHMNGFDNIAVVPRLLIWNNRKIKTRVDEKLGHDRNIKALVLKKNRAYIAQTNYHKVQKTDKPEKIVSAIEDSKVNRAMAVDGEGRFHGIFVLDRSKHSSKPRLTLLEDRK